MKGKQLFLSIIYAFSCLALLAENGQENEQINPVQDRWGKTNDRSVSSPLLYQGDSDVYVYTDKQLDNVTICITDMLGNVYHHEVITMPACVYYAVSISSLPVGQYYLSVYQGNNYVIGIFSK